MTGMLRLVVAPVLVALVVLAVVLGVMALADPSGEGPAGTVPGAGGGAPGATGSADPAAPSTEPGGGADPDAPMSPFSSVSRARDGRALDVRFWGGVEDCYRYTVLAEETARTVTLSRSEERTVDGACIELAQEYERTVPLEQPLGTRRVVDAVTGETLLGPTR
jgi:hypothetical protein